MVAKNTSSKRKESPVKEKDTKRAKIDTEVDLEGKNVGNVIGGYKATMQNPNVSDEAKERAEEIVDMLEDKNTDSKNTDSKKYSEDLDMEGKDRGHVIGGFKATLSNANSSEEAKDHARRMLEKLGASEETTQQPRFSEDFEGKDMGHVIAGFKGTLSNANSSEEAKKHAKDMLRRIMKEKGYNKSGQDIHHFISGYKSTLSNKSKSKDDTDHARKSLSHLEEHVTGGRHLGHVIGGYRATLSNPKVSDEAKEHARKMLDELGAEEYAADDDYETDFSGKNYNNVIGGYKAALHNPNSSEVAKEHAREVLEENGESEDRKTSGKDESEKNFNNVMGGYKAALHNPNSSDAAKDHAREVLEENGESEERKVQGKDDSEKNFNNVMGGYKATLHNDRASDEAKDNARKQLESNDVSTEAKGKEDSEKNPGNVIGGMKASLKNPNVSEEKKDEIRSKLDSSKVAY